MRKIFTFHTIIIMLVISLFITICIWAVESNSKGKILEWKVLISSDNENERISARQAVMDNHKETIHYLLSVVNRPLEEGEQFFNNRTSRNVAILLLGKLRAKEAASELIKWLSPKPGQGLKFLDLSMFSPAGYALVDIGLPSVPPLVLVLKGETTTALRQECIKIIVRIKGLPETELLFEEALAMESNSAKRDKLKDVLYLLKDQKFLKILENVHKQVNRL